MKARKIKIAVIGMLIISFGCTEEIDLQTEIDFQSSLVIEAIITNELKQQEILISRTFMLEEEGPSPETGANVQLVGNDGNQYNFSESEAGIYLSNATFAAQPNVSYNLQITTSNGRQYGSNTMQLTQSTGIDDLYFERGFNENDEEGVSVLIDSYNPNGNSKFYRYTYEETFKIIAPKWTSVDLVYVEGSDPFEFEFVEKMTEQRTCFGSVMSNTIILENTNVFEEDRVDGFRVRFIGRDNYIITHRYSILVTQYVQSREGHEFYKAIRDLSESESIFSQSQPGFINGNVFSLQNASEAVIGFFEVSAADSRRIYFNYEDLFPSEDLPPYIISCNPFAPLVMTEGGTSPLLDALNSGHKYYESNESPEETEGPYNLVLRPCGDCTALGSNVVPDFWED